MIDSDERFAETEYVVEASIYEKLCLWRENDKAPDGRKVNWHDEPMGLHLTVGTIIDFPVCISVSWAKLNGRRVMFYEPVSRIVDIEMIDRWLKANCNPRTLDDRRANCNAMNFGHCLHFVRTAAS